MEEATIRLHARILAIEYFLAEAFRMIYGLAQFSQEEIDASHRELREVLRTLKIPSWPAPGSEDTELGVLMELEVGHGETEVYARVQA
jgi:hypothetical protein